ncbi:MAG: GNAT family N-acetyltransferase [Candidatus Omnitrophica bacterium]|nr:GNAT family N-acetyltransferase [Candidatus Omnitrophota bacterium]
MRKKIELGSKRVLLRTLRPGDVNSDYVDGLNDPEVNRYLGAGNSRNTAKSVKAYVEKDLRSADSVLFGIFPKKEKKLVGTLRIHGISRYHYSCSVGICIFNKDHWGKGLAYEALKRVVVYLFVELGLHYVEAGCFKANKASVILFQKAGFKVQARYRDKYRHGDRFREAVFFSLVNRRFDTRALNK